MEYKCILIYIVIEIIEVIHKINTVATIDDIAAPGFALGVQWHPEYDWEADADSRAIFEAFGRACAAHRAARAGLEDIAQAAE